MNELTNTIVLNQINLKVIKVRDIVSACGIDYDDFFELVTNNVTCGDASFTLVTPNDMFEWRSIQKADSEDLEDYDIDESSFEKLKSILQDLIGIGDIYLAFEG